MSTMRSAAGGAADMMPELPDIDFDVDQGRYQGDDEFQKEVPASVAKSARSPLGRASLAQSQVGSEGGAIALDDDVLRADLDGDVQVQGDDKAPKRGRPPLQAKEKGGKGVSEGEGEVDDALRAAAAARKRKHGGKPVEGNSFVTFSLAHFLLRLSLIAHFSSPFSH